VRGVVGLTEAQGLYDQLVGPDIERATFSQSIVDDVDE
jgi:hypothetical protein